MAVPVALVATQTERDDRHVGGARRPEDLGRRVAVDLDELDVRAEVGGDRKVRAAVRGADVHGAHRPPQRRGKVLRRRQQFESGIATVQSDQDRHLPSSFHAVPPRERTKR